MLDRILAFLARGWEAFRKTMQILRVFRFTLGVLAVMVGLFMFADQGKEVLRVIAEDGGPKACWLFIGGMLAGLASWYWNRVLLYTSLYPQVSGTRREAELPRWLGVGPLLILALGCLLAIQGGKTGIRLIVLAGLLAVGAALLALFFAFRRRLFALAPVRVTRLRNLPRSSWMILGGSVLASVALTTVIFFDAVGVGSRCTAGAVALFAGAAWISIGVPIGYLGDRFKFPIVGTWLILCLVMGLIFEYHDVRTLCVDPRPATPTRIALTRWYDNLRISSGAVGGRPQRIPLILVAAEGGGIRAAYWTAHVLACLDSADDRFRNHVFAVSGVSGGSLGAVVYAALLSGGGKEPARRDSLPRLADTVLSADFLGPTVSTMLFPEIAQAAIGGLFGADRATTLEDSWSAAWDNLPVPYRGVFDREFRELWDSVTVRAPNLFLNGTSVEHGNRMIMSNLSIDAGIFPSSVDIYNQSSESYRLSTAVTMSARFTYVSPAGLLPGGASRAEHIVDGGYFDNSGAETLMDLAMFIRGDSGTIPGTELFVIHIANEPAEAGSTDESGKHSFFNLTQLEAPFRTLMSARSAHGEYAVSRLKHLVGEDHVLTIRPGLSRVSLPLGWQLSDACRSELNRLHRERAPSDINIIHGWLTGAFVSADHR